MSTIKSSAENLTLNADGSGNDIKFQSNASEVAEITDGGVISSTGGSTHTDNVKAKFGTGNDLEIYHNGTDSIINEAGTGKLLIQTDGTEISLTKTDSEYMARFKADSDCELYYDNAKKLETSATGITVTGAIAGATNLGKVLQVVSTTYTTAGNHGASSYQDTGLTVSITPSATSSKVLIMQHQLFAITTDTNTARAFYYNICRGSTQLLQSVAEFTNQDNTRHSFHGGLIYLDDNVSSTSSTTYKTQTRCNAGSADIFYQQGSTASTLTAIEIAG